jgi:hypothetical protein
MLQSASFTRMTSFASDSVMQMTSMGKGGSFRPVAINGLLLNIIALSQHQM